MLIEKIDRKMKLAKKKRNFFTQPNMMKEPENVVSPHKVGREVLNFDC